MGCAQFAPLSADAQKSTGGEELAGVQWTTSPCWAELPLSCSVLSSADTGEVTGELMGKKNGFFCKHSWYSDNTGVFYCTAPKLVHSIKLIYGCRDDGNWTAGAIGMGGMYWSTAQLWIWDDAPCAGELSPGRLFPGKGKMCLLMVTEHWPVWPGSLVSITALASVLLLASLVGKEGMHKTALLSSIWKITLRPCIPVCNLCKNVISHCYWVL